MICLCGFELYSCWVPLDRGTSKSGGNFGPSAAFVSRKCRVFCVLSTATWDSKNQEVFLMILKDFLY